MQTQRSVDDAAQPSQRLSRHQRWVPQRSARRATARQRIDDLEGGILAYVKEHPQSTIGDMAKGLNASRATIAAGVSHMVRAGEITRGLGGQIAILHSLSDRVTYGGGASDGEIGPTIIAALDDGPLQGLRIEA